MDKLNSKIVPESEEFKENYIHNKNLLSHWLEAVKQVKERHTSPSVIKHKERGRLTAWERIELLLDPHTPFLELSSLAAYDQYNNEFPSAGIISGIGLIHGHETMVIANDATVKGGTYIKETIRKHIRSLEIALENNIPCVYLVDSGGVFLPEQTRVFPDKEHFGRIFFLQAQLSSKAIPQISVVMGSCTAGGAYVPAMSDESVIVRNQGTIFLGGPPLVKAATGVDVTAEELGGGEVHTGISGVSDHLAEDDEHALQICRNVFETLSLPQKYPLNFKTPKAPEYAPDELYGVVSGNAKRQTDPYEVIARIVDESKFQEFKARYGTTLVTGFAHIMGIPVGIVANNGILFPESALKGTHFIELCNYRKIPLVFLQNITGFMVGKDYEHRGIAKEGAKMVHAVATANVPKITVVTGGSYGAGNYAMAGRAFNPNFMFMWPNARISVMGGEQAAQVLATVKEQQLEAKGEKLDEGTRQSMMDKIRKRYELESSAFYSSSRIWDDGIIEPAKTREILGLCLSVTLNKPIPDPAPGVFRM